MRNPWRFAGAPCNPIRRVSYTPYGFNPSDHHIITGFNGTPLITPTFRHYHLGQGHRVYAPAQMRFIQPDSLSPFGKGGINTYSYCSADPINFQDPDGTSRILTTWKNINWLAARGSKLLKPADWWKKGKEIVKWGTKIAAIAADLGVPWAATAQQALKLSSTVLKSIKIIKKPLGLMLKNQHLTQTADNTLNLQAQFSGSTGTFNTSLVEDTFSPFVGPSDAGVVYPELSTEVQKIRRQ